MGGRGSFASGINVAYKYKTIDKIEGVKVLAKINPKDSGGLPEESHSSSAYIQVNSRGEFKMYREYDENHLIKFDIAYHPEPDIDPSRKPVLHVHEYKLGDFGSRSTRPITKEEYNKYKKFLRGI